MRTTNHKLNLQLSAAPGCALPLPGAECPLVEGGREQRRESKGRRLTAILWLLAVIAAATSGCAPLRPAPASDLQGLIDRAADGDVIEIPCGEYILRTGLVLANRTNLTLTASPGARILVDDPEQDVVLIQNCKGISLHNPYLRHLTPYRTYKCHGAVVSVDGSIWVDVNNCELNGCGAVGFHASGTTGARVIHCYIHHNSFTAYYVESCFGVELRANRVTDNASLLQAHNTSMLEMADDFAQRNGGYSLPADAHPGLAHPLPAGRGRSASPARSGSVRPAGEPRGEPDTAAEPADRISTTPAIQ